MSAIQLLLLGAALASLTLGVVLLTRGSGTPSVPSVVSRKRLVLASLCIVAFLSLVAASWHGVAASWHAERYRSLPTLRLMLDLRSASGAGADAAWMELRRREEAGGLSLAQSDDLIDMTLRRLVMSPGGPLDAQMQAYVLRCAAANKLSPQQRAMVMRRAPVVSRATSPTGTGLFATATAAPLWLLVTLSGLTLMGVCLLPLGLWPHRKGDVLHCRRCDYNLTGLTGERCPECGSPIKPQNIAKGERRRRPLLALMGCLCLLTSAAAWFDVLRRVDWYPYKPAWLLTSELSSGASPGADRAWAELHRRYSAGRLSARQHARLIDICLKVQAAAGVGSSMAQQMLDFLGQSYISGQLSRTQADAFFSKMMRTQLKLLTPARAGTPVRISSSESTTTPRGLFWPTVKYGEIWLDGKASGHHLLGDVFIIPEAGMHRVQVTARIEVFVGTRGRPGGHVAYTADESLDLVVPVE